MLSEQALQAKRAYQRAYQREYAKKNREKINEYRRKYAKQHREKINEYQRRYRQANPDLIQEYRDRYWERQAQKVADQEEPETAEKYLVESKEIAKRIETKLHSPEIKAKFRKK